MAVSTVAMPKQIPSSESLGSAAHAMPNPTVARVRAMKRGVKGSIRGDMGGLVGGDLCT